MYRNPSDFPKSKSEEERQANIRKPTNANDEYKNPCLNEQKHVYKCLDDRGYDQKECKLYFTNYKMCKEFWTDVQKDRRKKGIKPYLPLPEEREKIKNQYMSHKK